MAHEGAGGWRRSGAWVGVLACSLACTFAGCQGWDTPVRGRESERKIECMSHVKVLAQAARLYVNDNDGAFPPGASWGDAIEQYVEKANPRYERESAFTCPDAAKARCAYAFNSALGGASYDIVTDVTKTVALPESDVGWNAAGGPEVLPARPRHLGGDNYAFADGHAQWLLRGKLGTDARGRPIWARQPDAEYAEWVIWEPVLKEDEGGADQ